MRKPFLQRLKSAFVKPPLELSIGTSVAILWAHIFIAVWIFVSALFAEMWLLAILVGAYAGIQVWNLYQSMQLFQKLVLLETARVYELFVSQRETQTSFS